VCLIRLQVHTVEVETEGRRQSIEIAPKSVGRGSSINGGELLFAALATCFCNDLYCEAAKRGMDVQEVNVELTGAFGNPGEPARDITYRVKVRADAPQAAIDDLIRATENRCGFESLQQRAGRGHGKRNKHRTCDSLICLLFPD